MRSTGENPDAMNNMPRFFIFEMSKDHKKVKQKRSMSWNQFLHGFDMGQEFIL